MPEITMGGKGDGEGGERRGHADRHKHSITMKLLYYLAQRNPRRGPRRVAAEWPRLVAESFPAKEFHLPPRRIRRASPQSSTQAFALVVAPV